MSNTDVQQELVESEALPAGGAAAPSESRLEVAIRMGRGRVMPDLLKPILLHEIFEATADRFPENVAAACGGAELTYVQLDRRANQLARHLRKMGIGRGALVGLLLPRGLDVCVAMLGILKAGAAYVPLDCDYPPNRVACILDDCKVAAVVTESALAAKHDLDGRHPVLLDRDASLIERQATDRLPAGQCRMDDLCYVIFTSGSTGRPKGVQIEHRSASHLVLAEKTIYGVEAPDRVFQGFSVAFDASVEEFWMAWACGATLVVGTSEMVHSGPALSDVLADAGVTVWSTVPTLLAVVPRDVPALRILILGGESCPPDLVRRWHRPGRRVFNTYGPTEATVIATYTLCEPDRPLTIGRPVPNYRLYILDDRLQSVPLGESGELCIGGVGLSRGYLGRDDLTAKVFCDDPFAAGEPHARLYRTGDLARFTPDGEIEYLGRMDTQVKIRGFRVELSEIESVLMQHPDIQTAVAAVRQERDIQQLVGYVIPRDGRSVGDGACDKLRAWLRTRLPAYMVPSILEPVDTLPRLPSGKVDRKRLPAPRPRQAGRRSEADEPQGPAERRIVAVWRELMSPLPVGREDHFFTDLGGHSLLAARMVSQLRKDADFADLSVTDVYNFPTPRALAAELERRRPSRRQAATGPDPAPAIPVSTAGYWLCCLGQAVGLYFIVGVFAAQWLAPFLVYSWLSYNGFPAVQAVALALAALLAFYPTTLLLSIIVKWTFIGRYRPGRHRLWGWYYLRWWLVEQFISAAPLDTLEGTPLLAWYYRLMGARIGPNVYIGTDNIRSFDVVSVGEDTCIGADSELLSYAVEDGVLKIAPISVGRRCFIGTRSIVGPGACMEDGAGLCDLSLLSPGASIPRGQRWIGSPARPLDPKLRKPPAPVERPSTARRAAMGLAQGLAVLVRPAVYLLAIYPGVLLLNLNYGARLWDWWFLALSPVVAVSFVVLLAAEIALMKWLLLGRVRPGAHSLTGWFHFRKWFFDQLMDMSLDLLGPLYATLYLLPWYRLLGARLGRRAEISTACAAQPDLLDLGECSFVADCASMGAPHVEAGRLTLEPIRIGKRAFIGNSAMVPVGATIGDDSLIGCLSAPPLSSPGASQADTSWLGSPAIFLPQRAKSAAFGAASTFQPTRKLYARRLAIEFFRVFLPATLFVAIASVLIGILTKNMPGQEQPGWASMWPLLAAFPLMYVVCGIAAALAVVAAKWILMGKYRPGERPLWSGFVWRTELLTALHENLANPFLVELLRGTPWVCWFFRLMGAKIGRRVFMDTTALTEFDLIRIGDGAMLNDDCTIQTHLFEDRVMKMSTIDIGAGCSIGAGSIVLYDTRMEDGSALGALSLMMKGESLPAGTRWEGSPARHCGLRIAECGLAVEHRQQATGDGQQSLALDVAFHTAIDGIAKQGNGSDAHVWVLDVSDNFGTPSDSRSDAVDGNSQSAIHNPQSARHALTRQVVGRFLNVPPDEVVLSADPHGRLTVSAAPLDLSIAHSEDVFVAGLAHAREGCRIGVDVEVVRDGIDVDALAAAHFSPAERMRLFADKSLAPARKQEVFLLCWTAKEAMAKAIGQGMSFGLDQIETVLDGHGSVRLASLNGSAQLADGWRIVHRTFPRNGGGKAAIVAVAVGGPVGAPS
ncbi:MAG: Pls/PosA family non-ribosomal peptide synthetase [Phycisphaerae bacterium]